MCGRSRSGGLGGSFSDYINNINALASAVGKANFGIFVLEVLLSFVLYSALFLWGSLSETCLYAARRVPEISDRVEDVDRAMRWGFGWELGPFQIMDTLGVDAFATQIKKEGRTVPAAIDKLLAAEISFVAIGLVNIVPILLLGRTDLTQMNPPVSLRKVAEGIEGALSRTTEPVDELIADFACEQTRVILA